MIPIYLAHTSSPAPLRYTPSIPEPNWLLLDHKLALMEHDRAAESFFVILTHWFRLSLSGKSATRCEEALKALSGRCLNWRQGRLRLPFAHVAVE